MSLKSDAKKDPILLDPLPNPGESLERMFDDAILDRFMQWGMLAGFMIMLVIYEWTTHLFNLARSPVITTIVAVLVIGFCGWKITKAVADLRNMKLGLRGEKAVGQYLERLREFGYFVLHDLVERDSSGRDYNIDHILVGPGGIFVLETKTRSKPAKGDSIIQYDGERVSVDGGPWDEEPIRQAKAAVRTVRTILEATTGRTDIPIRPVVLFPGWYIEGTSSGKVVWVLEPKGLPKWLAYEPSKLSREDVALFHQRLAEHMRLMSQRRRQQ